MNIYLFMYYSHLEEKEIGKNLLYKVVIVTGMCLSWALVLCLPLDAANARSFDLDVNMDLIW
jgi:hypothetical protein